MSIDSILSNLKPVEAKVSICMRGELYADLDELTARLEQYDGWEQSSLSDVDPRIELRAKIAALRAEMDEHSQTFRFRALGGKEYSDLGAAHPPTKNDKGEDEGAWNAQTYPVALVAAAAIEPEMTVEQAGRLFDLLSLDQRTKVFMAAYRASNRSVDVPFFEAASEPAASTD